MTGDTPLVSVVTPTLNRRELLAETVASVSAQSYPHLEHIVVDGGSTDGTVEMLASMAGIRWLSEPDGGMYEAVNKGLRLAIGDTYLNSDDQYLPWTVETVVEAFARYPDADFIYGDALNINATGRLKLNLQPPFSADYVRRYGFCASRPCSGGERSGTRKVAPTKGCSTSPTVSTGCVSVIDAAFSTYPRSWQSSKTIPTLSAPPGWMPSTPSSTCFGAGTGARVSACASGVRCGIAGICCALPLAPRHTQSDRRDPGGGT